MTKIVLPNNWEPRSYQKKAWKYLERGGRHAELIWHRRSGKDEIALHRAACAAFERVAGYWHMLPEYSQARKAIWDAVNPHTGKKRIDEAFPVELRKTTRNQEMMIEFKNGSTWQVVGSDSYNSLVGATPAGIVYSEWALANPNSRAYLRPILAENKGWQIFITTPRGKNHAYKTFQAARNNPDAYAEILDVEQTKVLTLEEIAREKRAYIDEFGEDYGLAKFDQEYMCSFTASNIGAILAAGISRLEKQGRIGSHVEFDPNGADFYISADIGRKDTSTWYFWQPTIGGYTIFDYDCGFGLDADQWCDRLRDKISQYKRANGSSALGKIWLPHDARNKTFAAKYSAIEIFLKYFGASHVKITPDSKKADRVNAARRIIQRCEFSDKCEKGLEGLSAWSYIWDEERRIFSSDPDHNWASHDGDGFSYGCLIAEQIKPKEPEKPAKFNIKAQNGVIITAPLDELWQDVKRHQERY
jgi:hypothetical protein